MKSRHSVINILAVLFVLPLTAPLVRGAITIDVLSTFDYPGVGNSTLPQKINDRGDIAGYYIDSSGVTRGFVRFRDGTFSAPIVEPNDTAGATQVRGINNLRTVCGTDHRTDNTTHGFFLAHNTFTDFDVPDALNTYVWSLNDAGDFCGRTDLLAGGNPGFISIGGNLVLFVVPGSEGFNEAFGMNNSDQIAGTYFDGAGTGHGFFRDADGTFISPIDPPDSVDTSLFGLNDQKWMVGRYVDDAGITHALVAASPARFIAFDYPGATFTSFNGINRQGLICGRYQDSSGVGHGILARVRRMPAD
ncbi:MAG TPA: hypothetical protein VGI60_03760 [Chthoniobacterales bacterium]|jgi:hypothetical protein